MRTAMLPILLLASALAPVIAAEPAAGAVVLLDGREFAGAVSIVDAETVAVADEQIALADVDAITFGPPAAPVRDPELPAMVLADGGWLPLQGLSAGADEVSAITPYGRFALQLGEIVAWGPPAWLSDPPASGDRVLLDNGEYDGAVLGIADGQLRMEVAELGELAIGFERVRGLWLDLPRRRPAAPVFALPAVVGRPPALLLPVAGEPRLFAAPDQRLEAWPGGRLRVSGGRRVWLAELAPSTVAEEGAFGVVWPYRRNENFDGGPITIAGQVFLHGLVVHSRARLVWPLDGGYVRLHAVIGLEDLVADEGAASVRLLVDGEERWADTELTGSDGASVVDLDLSGASELSLVIDYGPRYDIGDHVALGDAFLVRAAE